jgi:hypothetical protein
MQGLTAFNHVRPYPAGTLVYATGQILTTATNLDDGGFDNIRVEGNVADVSFPQAISYSSVRGLVMKNNAVTTIDGATYRASLNVASSTYLEARCGNSVGAGKLADGSIKAGYTEAACPVPLPPPPPVVVVPPTELELATAEVARLTAALATLQSALDAEKAVHASDLSLLSSAQASLQTAQTALSDAQTANSTLTAANAAQRAVLDQVHALSAP